MKALEKKVVALREKAKKLKGQQLAGKNHNGFRDADNLLIAASNIEKAIHYINLVK